MPTHLPPVGARIRLTRAVDRFPDFIAPSGAMGTVTESSARFFSARMDVVIEGAEEWDNNVGWNLPEDEDIDAVKTISAKRGASRILQTK